MKKHIIVIGGGLAGTSAAYALTSKGYKVTILERSDYLGGRIHSISSNGTTFEAGATFAKNCYTNLLSFLEGTDLKDNLYRPKNTHAGIIRDREVRMADARTLVGSKALSLPAKLQAISLAARVAKHWQKLNLHAMWQADSLDNRSVAEAFTSRSGAELMEYAIQPALNGYLYWTPEHTSDAMLLTTLKAFAKGGTYRLRGGLQQIPAAAATTSAVLLNHEITRVQQKADNTYEISARYNGKAVKLAADGIVCATTASVVPRILSDLTDTQLAFFKAIPYSATALVAEVYKSDETMGDIGIAFPRNENKQLSAATIAPEPNNTVATLSTLKLYVSGAYSKGYLTKTDENIVKDVKADLGTVRNALLKPGAKPLSTHVQRWQEALPLFDVGHFKRLRSFANGDIESPNPGLVFAGDYLGGPFMEGAFTSGLQAAERLDEYLSSQKETR
jgi:oxygen-dependent protoporphyrinogen oxidase